MAYEIGTMISGQDQISALFTGTAEPEETTQEAQDPTEEPVETQEENEDITEMTPSELFSGEASERVGDEEHTEGTEGEPSDEKGGSSPANLYSSIANSLAEDGTLSNLSEDDLKEVKDPETLVAAMKKQMDSMLSDEQRRIKNALDAGLEPPQITQYENAIKYLDSVTDDLISAETTDGENLRKGIIYQYQLSLGVPEERATKMVDRAVNSGTDIEDAKECLGLLKEYYRGEYSKLIEDGKKQVAAAKKQQEEDLKKMKNTLLQDKNILGDIEIDAKTRQLAFDNWMKPTHRNEKGDYQSAIQKYIAENPMDFQMKVALLFTMTDGFQKMGNVLKQTVKKEKKKAMQELEHAVNSTQRLPSGAIDMRGNMMFGGMQVAPQSSWNK